MKGKMKEMNRGEQAENTFSLGGLEASCHLRSLLDYIAHHRNKSLFFSFSFFLFRFYIFRASQTGETHVKVVCFNPLKEPPSFFHIISFI